MQLERRRIGPLSAFSLLNLFADVNPSGRLLELLLIGRLSREALDDVVLVVVFAMVPNDVLEFVSDEFFSSIDMQRLVPAGCRSIVIGKKSPCSLIFHDFDSSYA
jgi:hypothetical protein